MKNIGVSLYEKIKNSARASGFETSVVLRRYVQERLLYRISISKYADDFCLKGGILLSAYNDGELLRPSEDIDLSGFKGDGTVQKLEEVLREILAMSIPEDDGVSFDMASMRVLKDRTGIIPGGKVSIIASLHTAKVPLRVDVGFGNVITPESKLMEMPTILSNEVPRPTVNAYPLETVIAEKLHAMAQFGFQSTRVKDHFDIFRLATKREFDGEMIVEAIRNTFLHQKRVLPEEIGCLTDEYARRQTDKWEDLVEKTGIDPISFPEAMVEINQFMRPLIAAARDNGPLPGSWQHDGGWAPSSVFKPR
jgi:predicted nucleotidyltransferase component of viral defense system